MTATASKSYAIISLGGKQYTVREGERLLVERLKTGEGKTFQPDVLFLGDGGDGELGPTGTTVTARVVGHVLGKKVRIGKYRPKSGYKRHNGYRSRLSQIEIESIGKGGARKTAAKPAAEARPKAEAADQVPAGLAKGYADLTVAQIAEASKTWNRPMLEAALEYEQDNAKRKGAISALESALAAKEDG